VLLTASCKQFQMKIASYQGAHSSAALGTAKTILKKGSVEYENGYISKTVHLINKTMASIRYILVSRWYKEEATEVES